MIICVWKFVLVHFIRVVATLRYRRSSSVVRFLTAWKLYVIIVHTLPVYIDRMQPSLVHVFIRCSLKLYITMYVFYYLKFYAYSCCALALKPSSLFRKFFFKFIERTVVQVSNKVSTVCINKRLSRIMSV